MPATTPSVVNSLEALGATLWRSGSASAQSVAALERELEIVLPASFKDFLLHFGAVAIGDSTISGIIDDEPMSSEGGSLVGDTKRMRTESGLPMRYLVIQPDEEAPYVLDAGAPNDGGEFPVVCYELHSGHAELVADSFDKWLVGFFYEK